MTYNVFGGTLNLAQLTTSVAILYWRELGRTQKFATLSLQASGEQRVC